MVIYFVSFYEVISKNTFIGFCERDSASTRYIQANEGEW